MQFCLARRKLAATEGGQDFDAPRLARTPPFGDLVKRAQATLAQPAARLDSADVGAGGLDQLARQSPILKSRKPGTGPFQPSSGPSS